MGCWNGTCAISNLHIFDNQDVMVLMLAKNKKEGSLCYSQAHYQLLPIPFYGQYNDYGAVTKCHGIFLEGLVKKIKKNLFEMEVGTNEYHDIAAKKDEFNIEKLFELDHEGRLGIHNQLFHSAHYDLRDLEDLEKERELTEVEKIKKTKLMYEVEHPDTFQRLTHIIIHQKVVNDILEKYYFEDYDNGKYTKVFFKDIIADLDSYIQAYQKQIAENKMMFDLSALPYNTNRAQDFIDSATRSSQFFTPLFSRNDMGKWLESGHKEALQEVCKVFWLNHFMNETRRVWVKPCGVGSQSQEDQGYRILAQSVLDILDEEKRRFQEENGEEEEED